MGIDVHEIGENEHSLYASVPIRFLVESIFDVSVLGDGLTGFTLVERSVSKPYVKDYDQGESHRPASWVTRFDTRDWGIFLASDAGRPIGGATVAVGSAIYPMDRFQRTDLAVLWDLRVHPDRRREGIGEKLFWRAANWARGRGRGQLGMETQNVNVGACRFYARMGCQLGAIHRLGYAGCPEVAGEAMLLWYLDLC